MKNWIKFFAIFLPILAILIFAFVAIGAYTAFSSIEGKAEDAVLKEKLLISVTDSYVFHGNNAYVTVIGKDAKGEKRAVFVNQEKVNADKKVSILLKDGITKEKASSITKEKKAVTEILHTKLGIQSSKIVWEVTYTDDQDKLNYLYLNFKDGKIINEVTDL